MKVKFLIVVFVLCFSTQSKAKSCICSSQVNESTVLIIAYDVSGDNCRDFSKLAVEGESVVSRGFLITHGENGVTIIEGDANPSSECS